MRHLLVAILVLSILMPSVLLAESGDTHVFINGALQLPLNPEAFKDGWKMGFGGGAGVRYSITPVIGLVGEFDYHFFGLDAPSGSDLSGADASIIYASGGIKLRPMGNSENAWQPILLAGGGFYHLKTTDLKQGGANIGGGGDESTFGAHVGGGIEFIDAFVEAVYIIGFTEGESTGHVAFRIGYGINLGG